MSCTPIKLPGGGTAIVCTRGPRRAPKCECGKAAPYFCDGCDEPTCREHNFELRKGLDFCRNCSAPLKRWWLANDGAPYAGEPKSRLLLIFTQWARENEARFPRSHASKVAT